MIFITEYMKTNGPCDGHLLFVTKENSVKFITITLQATVQYGEKLVEEGKIDGYHFGMNMREPAGQSVMWPHVHFMPRKTRRHRRVSR